MVIHVSNLIIGDTKIDLNNTTPEQVIYDRNHPKAVAQEMTLPKPDINKYKHLGQHLKQASEGPHLKSYLSDMVTPLVHLKARYRLKGLEKTHKKSSYELQFLKE